ncbi:DUF397 domain-containing protein [Streptomyces celluloflavus]|uniref:DUF397 domain-containing protein n=1 Tax=Streptomyces celluloflavus TaxID=58344 RepID=A0ABW7RDB3_9ACTN
MNEPIVRVWRKSSYSGNENACLEILTPPHRARLLSGTLKTLTTQ